MLLMDEIYQVYRSLVSSIQLIQDTNNLIKINEQEETAHDPYFTKSQQSMDKNRFNMNVWSKDTHDKDIHPL